jgi:hypothetical protein
VIVGKLIISINSDKARRTLMLQLEPFCITQVNPDQAQRQGWQADVGFSKISIFWLNFDTP